MTSSDLGPVPAFLARIQASAAIRHARTFLQRWVFYGKTPDPANRKLSVSQQKIDRSDPSVEIVYTVEVVGREPFERMVQDEPGYFDPPLHKTSGGQLHDALNPAQREAVMHRDGPLLVVAGPGSGKTRVVTHRIAQLLLTGVPSHQILALTFTNKAADEMKRRVQSIVPGSRVWIGTFHRFCAMLLRQYAPFVGLTESFSIFDSSDSLRICKEAIALHPQLKYEKPANLLFGISRLKSKLISYEEYVAKSAEIDDHILSIVYPVYQKYLLKYNAVDFDDLLLHIGLMLRDMPDLRRELDRRFRYIMVDEYQDTNVAQYAIVRSLSVDFPNLAATGDPDQSIYGWRGADVRNILDFEKDFPHASIVRLEQNYRSTPNILHVADTLIGHNQFRRPKSLFTENPEGDPVRLVVYVDHHAEAEAIAARITQWIEEGGTANDVAILYRVSHLSRAIELAFRRRGIPYQVVRGTQFYDRQEVKDALAYLELIHNERNDAAFLRILNVPRRGLGRVTEKRIRNYAEQHGMNLLSAIGCGGLQDQLSKQAAQSVAQLHHWIRAVQSKPPQGIADLLRRILHDSGYLSSLRASETEEDQGRADNLEEFLGDAAEFDEQNPQGSVGEFLENVALVSDADHWDGSSGRVTLMTLHAAKGLEFPCVFLVGVEHNLLPHIRAQNEPMELEEERRLLFVGITRAKTELQLSCAKRRTQHGETRPTIASHFLLELPRDSMVIQECLEPARGNVAISHDDAWDDDEEFFSDDDGADDDFKTDDDLKTDGDVFVPIVRKQLAADPPQRPASAVTAASLISAGQSPGVAEFDEKELRLGGAVLHPEYGPGKLVEISGVPPRRSVTVQFALTGKSHTFVLELSPLRPVRRFSSEDTR
ncbi:MAG: UvrD-helicase domain-containing protein [Planctomycetota bacterium]|nr:UvrD-helicase domain-containing protein [Planctomycetota bacterium]MDA1177544.1 UvrD-helicase domain-containing protein [Planctomycetota bacterium]